MVSKYKNSTDELELFKIILKEKYLLLAILIISFLFSLTIIFFNKKNFDENRSTVVIKLPRNSDFFLFFDKLDNLIDVAEENRRLNSQVVFHLSSLSNLDNFFNQPKSLEYLQVFKKHKLDIKLYFQEQNFRIENSKEFDPLFIKLLKINYPLDLNLNNFLRDYISFISTTVSKNFIDTNVKKLKNQRNIFSKIYDEKQKYRIDSRVLENINDKKNLLNNFLNFSSDEQTFLKIKFYNEMLKLYSEDEQTLIKIKFYDALIELISQSYLNIDYEILKTERISNSKNKIFLISFICGFFIFFAIIIFKEFYKKYLMY